MPLPPHVVGYAVPLVAKPGERVSFRLSADRRQVVRACIVRMACTNPELDGPPERLEPLPVGCPDKLTVNHQPLDPGSRLEARLAAAESAGILTIGLGLRPTRDGLRQTILALGDAASDALSLMRAEDGTLDIVVGERTIRSGEVLPSSVWTVLSVTVDLVSGRITVGGRTTSPGLPPDRQGVPVTISVTTVAEPSGISFDHLRLASGCAAARQGFDGKLDLPVVMRGAHDLVPLLVNQAAETFLAKAPDLIVAFSFRATGQNLQPDIGGRVEGRMIHHPLSAVKGMRWTGETHDRRLKPAHYSALQFNSDAMTDAGWGETVAVSLPDDVQSGACALELTGADGTRSFAPFFVSAAGQSHHRLAFLAPTLSYLAYANAPEAMRGPPSKRGLLPAEQLLDTVGGAFGRSLYERFADGSGVVVTGERKPLLSIGPDFRLWGHAADSMLTDWMEREGFAHDCLTDHDLHRDGAAALADVDVLVTGSHPEYWTTPMWDALSGWIAAGGRLLYLGGNGFYWRTAVADDGAIEVRRAEDGTRPFIGEPAEYVHAFSDEPGGLWRRLGRPPQALVGVGMAAQGFSRSTHYCKAAAADDPAVAFIFDGVDGMTFGHGGLMGGGAAGYEIDRFDAALGSDPEAWVLASSEGHPADMLRTKEEMLSFVPPFADRKARADMVLTVQPNGAGGVFAPGSIAWIGSLADPASDGQSARITANVLRRFLDRAPLPRQSGQR